MKALKIFLIFTFTLLSASCSFSQYQSVFGENFTEWNYLGLTCDVALVRTYIIQGDTSINNVNYKKLDNNNLIRESEAKDKIWLKRINSNIEFLILDLELSLGDTFNINSNEFIVDSVFSDDGIKIIQFNYEPPNCGFFEKLKFIEGVGLNIDFNFLIDQFQGESRQLRCHTKDSITNFYLTLYNKEQCGDDILSAADVKQKQINYYPNPFKAEIIINFQNTQTRRIKILNLIGQLVMTEESFGKQIIFDTSGLTNGWYILIIEMDSKREIYKILKSE